MSFFYNSWIVTVPYVIHWLKTRENERVINGRRAGPLVIAFFLFLFFSFFKKNSHNLITSIEMRKNYTWR